MPPTVNTRVTTHPALIDVAVELDINLTAMVTHAKVMSFQSCLIQQCFLKTNVLQN